MLTYHDCAGSFSHHSFAIIMWFEYHNYVLRSNANLKCFFQNFFETATACEMLFKTSRWNIKTMWRVDQLMKNANFEFGSVSPSGRNCFIWSLAGEVASEDGDKPMGLEPMKTYCSTNNSTFLSGRPNGKTKLDFLSLVSWLVRVNFDPEFGHWGKKFIERRHLMITLSVDKNRVTINIKYSSACTRNVDLHSSYTYTYSAVSILFCHDHVG